MGNKWSQHKIGSKNSIYKNTSYFIFSIKSYFIFSMKSRTLGHKSDKSCNHRKDLFLLWAFLLFQGCKLSYWWYLGWTHSSLKECILLHFHGKGVQMLWSSLSAAGCSAGSRSILFRVGTQQLLETSCDKHTFCLWRLLLEAPGSGRWLLGERHRSWCARVGVARHQCQTGIHFQISLVWSDRPCDQSGGSNAMASPDPPSLLLAKIETHLIPECFFYFNSISIMF